MRLSKYMLLIVALSMVQSALATNYYINSKTGNNNNNGTGPQETWRTTAPANRKNFQAGDSLLFASGQVFTGTLVLQQVQGDAGRPIVISSYGFNGQKKKPVLDAGDQLNGVWIQNSSYVTIHDLEIKTSVPPALATTNQKAPMRCGILVEVTTAGDYSNIKIDQVSIHDIYFSPPGTMRSAAETKTANGSQAYGYGIRFINNTPNATLTSLSVTQTNIDKVSHTGLKLTANSGHFSNVILANNNIKSTGGPGMQMSGVNGAHVYHNNVDGSGSIADTRNWGRGSGFWTWGCTGVLIEHNRFVNANGPGDSAGVHIDYNCNDVVVQYNFSANNAGGFCEILGNNHNCAYRYNISVNDGHRIKGKNGAFQEGKIFWLSGYQGNEKGKAGPYNSYFYNNTIYVGSAIVPKIAVSSSSKGVLVANNIFYFEREPLAVSGDQKPLDDSEPGSIPNVVCRNNLFVRANSWPVELPFKDDSPLWGDPSFSKKGGLLTQDYIPQNHDLVGDKGSVIEAIPNDEVGLKFGLKVEKDIMGNKVIGKPDVGAIEIK